MMNPGLNSDILLLKMLYIVRYFSRSSKLRQKFQDDAVYNTLARDIERHYQNEHEKESKDIEDVFNKVTGKSYKKYGKLVDNTPNAPNLWEEKDIDRKGAGRRKNPMCETSKSMFDATQIYSNNNSTCNDVDFANAETQNFKTTNKDHRNNEIDNYNFDDDDIMTEGIKSISIGNNGYQDLTYGEFQKLQEFEAKSRIKNPFNSLNKNKIEIDPVRDAKSLIKSHFPYKPNEIKDIEETDEQDLVFSEMFVQKNRFDEIVSRIRNKIRIEKMQSSDINNSTVPNIKGVIVDPIKRHVNRRAARIGTMLHTHIEQLLTCNDPEFLYHHLKGASISINYVVMETSKSVVKCYYTVLSSHDPKEVQESLDVIAPKMRFWIARKLELGYTPPIKFIKYNKRSFVDVKDQSKSAEFGYNLPLEYTHNLQFTFHRRFQGFR